MTQPVSRARRIGECFQGDSPANPAAAGDVIITLPPAPEAAS
ncbi:MAG TPA: hypothetical protein VG142_08095 [Trebonia sp.]|nr:hypothetical protein [Trebonia sp.]